MYFYHGYALGVASTIPQKGFTEAVCALSITGGESRATKSTKSLPSDISFKANSSIRGWAEDENRSTVWYTEGSVVIDDLDIQGKFSAAHIEAHLNIEDHEGDYGRVVITGSRFDEVKVDGKPITLNTSDDLSVRYSTYASMEGAFEASSTRDHVLACLVGRDLDEQHATTPDLGAAYSGYQKQKALQTLRPLVLCSFVKKVNGGGGFTAWGPIISVRGFGNIYLGEVLVWPWLRCLNMFRIELESGGTVSGGSTGFGGMPFP